VKKVYIVTITGQIPVVAHSAVKAESVATQTDTLCVERNNFHTQAVEYSGGALPGGISRDAIPWGDESDRTIEEWLGKPRQYQVKVPVGLAEEFAELARQLGLEMEETT